MARTLEEIVEQSLPNTAQAIATANGYPLKKISRALKRLTAKGKVYVPDESVPRVYHATGIAKGAPARPDIAAAWMFNDVLHD